MSPTKIYLRYTFKLLFSFLLMFILFFFIYRDEIVVTNTIVYGLASNIQTIYLLTLTPAILGVVALFMPGKNLVATLLKFYTLFMASIVGVGFALLFRYTSVVKAELSLLNVKQYVAAFANHDLKGQFVTLALTMTIAYLIYKPLMRSVSIFVLYPPKRSVGNIVVSLVIFAFIFNISTNLFLSVTPSNKEGLTELHRALNDGFSPRNKKTELYRFQNPSLPLILYFTPADIRNKYFYMGNEENSTLPTTDEGAELDSSTTDLFIEASDAAITEENKLQKATEAIDPTLPKSKENRNTTVDSSF